MSLENFPNLNELDPVCIQCIKQYRKKHNLKKEDKFLIPCEGIKKQYLDEYILSNIEDPESAAAIFDPVLWAKKNLDWICIDPKGEEWKRKTDIGTLPTGFLPWNPVDASKGKSPFNRPYQAIMLRCHSRRKVARCGRQVGKSDVIAVNIIYKMFTNENYEITVICPYHSQITVIFDRIEQLLKDAPELYNSIDRYVKSPNHSLALKNGSKVIGFSAGTKSNAAAGVVRGQHGQELVFDEADMLSRQDIDSTLALIINFPNAVVWMSSTPTGKRETFYNASYDPEYKEFYYPSSVNPVYSKVLDDYFRKNLTELGYLHEVLALFGEDVQGVYQKAYIEAAKADYQYGDIGLRSGWVYSFGVDWNDVAGTVIRVTAWNPGDNSFFAVAREVVKKEGWTQSAAIDKIVTMNRFWNPSFIYVDKGYGAAQVEILHGMGFMAMKDKNKGKGHPDSRLATIVKAYNFGGTIEVHDLFTKLPVKKPSKAFLVESSVRCFEDGRIKFPKSDELLAKALNGYIIIRRTEDGVPKYGFIDEAIGDHDVDALNLSIIPFVLEKGELGTPHTFLTNVSFSGYPGEKPWEIKDREEQRKQITSRVKEGVFEEIIARNVASSISGLPAANTTQDKGKHVKIWSWPGFLRDEPPPRRKRLAKARVKPRRANI